MSTRVGAGVRVMVRVNVKLGVGFKDPCLGTRRLSLQGRGTEHIGCVIFQIQAHHAMWI
jgi:hypothetical protein